MQLLFLCSRLSSHMMETEAGLTRTQSDGRAVGPHAPLGKEKWLVVVANGAKERVQ